MPVYKKSGRSQPASFLRLSSDLSDSQVRGDVARTSEAKDSGRNLPRGRIFDSPEGRNLGGYRWRPPCAAESHLLRRAQRARGASATAKAPNGWSRCEAREPVPTALANGQIYKPDGWIDGWGYDSGKAAYNSQTIEVSEFFSQKV